MPRSKFKEKNRFLVFPRKPKRESSVAEASSSRIDHSNVQELDVENMMEQKSFDGSEYDFREEYSSSMSSSDSVTTNTTTSSMFEDNENGSDYRKMVSAASDDVLLVVSAAVLARDSQSAFRQRISIFDKDIRTQCSILFRKSREELCKLYLCFSCGKSLTSANEACCKGVVCTHIRAPMMQQARDFLAENMDEIRKVRFSVDEGNYKLHNLNGQKFRENRKAEKPGEINLSLIASIDGVSVVGKTNQKVWLLTAIVVDLETMNMQKVDNLLLGAIIECPENPTVFCWNEIWSRFISDLRNIDCYFDNNKINFNVVSLVADQPAKKSIFHMVGHNSACGCMFCLSPETFYKLESEDREEKRGTAGTKDDAKKGVNGFKIAKVGTRIISPEILKSMMPYDTIIDIFHDGAEGFCYVVAYETNTSKTRKSSLFVCDKKMLNHFQKDLSLPKIFQHCKKMRNGTAKNDYFRLVLFLSSLTQEIHKPHARIIIIGFSMLINPFYTDSDLDEKNIEDLSDCLHVLLNTNHKFYCTLKSHELIYHTKKSYVAFGNLATISTASFESAYKVILGDSKTTITNSFCEFATSRFIASVTLRREILNRSQQTNTSDKIERFVRELRHSKRRTFKYDNRILFLNSEDRITTTTNLEHYAVVHLPFGRLVSNYCNKNTKDDMVFLRTPNSGKTARFISLVKSSGRMMMLVELVNEIREEDKLKEFRESLKVLPMPLFNASTKILGLLISYRSVSFGVLSGRRKLINIADIMGVGAYWIESKSKMLTIVQATGAPVHV